MNDLLSAASLMLAILGILYGAWYPEIISMRHVEITDLPVQCKTSYRQVSAVLYGKVLPLCIVSSFMSIIFLPDTINILLFTLQELGVNGISYLRFYSAVNTAFFVVEVLLIVYSCYVINIMIKLIKVTHLLSLGMKPKS